jgi:hypothetical protein
MGWGMVAAPARPCAVLRTQGAGRRAHDRRAGIEGKGSSVVLLMMAAVVHGWLDRA